MSVIKIICIHRRLRKSVGISGICGILSTSLYFKIIYRRYEGNITKINVVKDRFGGGSTFQGPLYFSLLVWPTWV